jgi:hypothetical protein
MSFEWEQAKRRRNVADGNKETKGLKYGFCNRTACQKPLLDEPIACSMVDFESNSSTERLYYCMACAKDFDKWDRHIGDPVRISRDTDGAYAEQVSA